jgi:hypothetical protein
MPIPPYTWLANDFPSASLLTQELRQLYGNPFALQGVGYHARRPVYKSFSLASLPHVATAGTFQPMYQGTHGDWGNVADSAAFNGGYADEGQKGAVYGGGLINGGGAAGVPGGLILFMNWMPWTSVASSTGVSGQGHINGATVEDHSTGTIQSTGTTAAAMTTWGMDIMDWGATYAVSGLYTAAATTLTPGSVTAGDGSGQVAREQAFWASVYPANGTTVSAIPTISTSIGTGSTLTPAILNASIQNAMQLLNMPPLLRVVASASTSVPTATATTIAYPAPAYDTYSGFASNTYTVPLKGLYLVFACSGFDSPTNSNQSSMQSIKVNSTTLNGVRSNTLATAPDRSATVRILSLNAGDTLQHQVTQTCTGTLSTSTTNPSMFLVLWLGAVGSSAASWTAPPDTTYPFMAGLPASLVGPMFTSHVMADIDQLIYRPYAFAQQTTAQTGLAQNAMTAVNMQTYTGVVHGDSGSLYGSWNNGTWTAGANGYYLIVGEVVCATPTTLTVPQTIVGLSPSPGGAGVDAYQHQICYLNGSGGGGAAAGVYYLRSGDTIEMMVDPISQSATTSSLVAGSHLEIVWLGE